MVRNWFYWAGIGGSYLLGRALALTPCICLVFLLYDHLCTLPSEIECIWTRAKPPVWFLLNRYFGLISCLSLAIFLHLPGENSNVRPLSQDQLSKLIVCVAEVGRLFLSGYNMADRGTSCDTPRYQVYSRDIVLVAGECIVCGEPHSIVFGKIIALMPP